ncbi:GNAT family N-acetyltransferase [Sphingomonas sp. PAMC 26621]|uniref:GNAT family N-acetyltransferase n=1 Tax=Sphingomonas sp. PAMC 26621 TaxID=1112213 RepID=UPI00028879CA|nr:GNAT family N-acetyltransferase [Sphingomonas sp. PAMC 26621]
MNKPSQQLSTRTGFTFHVRPARPADDGTVADFFTHVTHEDLRFRFLTGLNEVGPAQIAALTHVDHRWSENFLAFTSDGSMMIATAMLACDPGFDRGEVAIAIRKDFKLHGLGWALLAHIARFADAKGVKVLEAIESRDNHAAIEVEREMGFTVTGYAGDSSLLRVTRELGRDGLPAAILGRPM